jgi:hypothetical protein
MTYGGMLYGRMVICVRGLVLSGRGLLCFLKHPDLRCREEGCKGRRGRESQS